MNYSLSRILMLLFSHNILLSSLLFWFISIFQITNLKWNRSGWLFPGSTRWHWNFRLCLLATDCFGSFQLAHVILAIHWELQFANQLLNGWNTVLISFKRWKAMALVRRPHWQNWSIKAGDCRDGWGIYSRQSLHRQLWPSTKEKPSLWCQSYSVEITVIKLNTQNQHITDRSLL